ncbi:hypothetical protein I203_101995 [Kwoniella mangroviensis CBS 8507]|uniref:uncharacterized protein n=1 Tax=Kwoniella mangroviensis CBS 8507 TaxID=1296122 RepID=UPI00080D4034|nr:uncharacterized protein I203_03191 [Kwoniella mangroviensis CBS 8507]OCF67494.1 hypothetical protein I203_03191 [Kwoniella mangroviensis CBS 8507]
MSKIIIKAGSTFNTPSLNGRSKTRSESVEEIEIESTHAYDRTNDEYSPPLNKEEQRIRDSKARYEEDVKKHQVVEVKPSRLEDDWQIAYVWSFIIKFNLRNHIPKLESLQDFEGCLKAPVANRPDDIFESILICFLTNLKNLKYGNKNLTPENVQQQTSNHINDQLTNTSEWTVWDRGWPINEEDRGSCCTSDPHRSELGRLRYYGEPSNARASKNPISQVEQKGGGLFEIDWWERAKLLRQLVDWQLTHSESIRNIIHREFPAKANDSRGKKPHIENEGRDSIIVKELGLTRDRARIWSFDDSWRLYKSGNPYKRPCQLSSITTDRGSYERLIEEMESFSKSVPETPAGKGSSAKGSKAPLESKRLAQAKKNEGDLAERLKERIESVEKEESRIQRARRKIAQALEMQQQAEMRSTRTRRQSKKVDYVYDDHSDFDSDSGPSRKRRHISPEFQGLDDKGRPIIPGERRLARQLALDVKQQQPENQQPVVEDGSVQGQEENSEEGSSIEMSRSAGMTRSSTDSAYTANGTGMDVDESDTPNENGHVDGDGSGEIKKKRKKGMKGYVWVEEFVPYGKA